MKAPDKIYIQTNKGEAFSSKWTTVPFRDFENTEYIRKDALLEKLRKATESYKKRSDEGELVWQNMCGINEAINILNKM
jgi:hypothetical protein